MERDEELDLLQRGWQRILREGLPWATEAARRTLVVTDAIRNRRPLGLLDRYVVLLDEDDRIDIVQEVDAPAPETLRVPISEPATVNPSGDGFDGPEIREYRLVGERTYRLV